VPRNTHSTTAKHKMLRLVTAIYLSPPPNLPIAVCLPVAKPLSVSWVSGAPNNSGWVSDTHNFGVHCNLKLASKLHNWCIQVNSAFYPSGVGGWGPASAGKEKAGMVHSVSRWTRGVQVKLWDPLRRRTELSALEVCSRWGAI